MDAIRVKNLLGLTCKELEELAIAYRQPRYRGGQLYHAIYVRHRADFDDLTDLDKSFRLRLSNDCKIQHPSIESRFESRDGAVRYLLALEDKQTIEAVYMPEEDRKTLCLSSQAGCAVDCHFCFTALLGLKRNLTAGEIIGQVIAILMEHQLSARSRVNVVFMGMGEPLLNFASVLKSIRLLTDTDGLAIPWRRITLSTVGIVPGIEKLGSEAERPKLAISLNASTDEQRSTLMPVNRKYPLADLLAACRSYPLRPRERLTFEYVMIEGFNDSPEDARRVVKLLKGLRAKVNLIPYNPGPEMPYHPPPFARVLAFQKVLTERELPAFIRISRGQDVRAACGQLSLASRGAQDHLTPITSHGMPVRRLRDECR